jgi:hypothetical protein
MIPTSLFDQLTLAGYRNLTALSVGFVMIVNEVRCWTTFDADALQCFYTRRNPTA